MAVPAVEISRFERFSISTIEEERRVSRLNSSEINDGYHARTSFSFLSFPFFFLAISFSMSRHDTRSNRQDRIESEKEEEERWGEKKGCMIPHSRPWGA